MYLVSFVMSLALSALTFYDLNGKRAALVKLKAEVEQKENQVTSLNPPTPEEQTKWAEQETQLSTILISDQNEPQLQAEISQLAMDNGLQRVAMTPEDKQIDPNKPGTPEEAKAAAAGIHRYLSITVRFVGQYPDIARFLGDVSKLPRPILYHLIELERKHPITEVQVVMNIYKMG